MDVRSNLLVSLRSWASGQMRNQQDYEIENAYRRGYAQGYMAATGSLPLLEVLSEMKVYIEQTEECMDGEWGLRRGFDEIHKAGEVTENYDLICAIIAANHLPNMR